MTLEEMERGFEGLHENMTVQGALMHRLENGSDGLRAIVAENSSAIAHNTQAIARSFEAIGKLTDAMMVMQDSVRVTQDGMRVMQDGMTVMQATMNNLFERMDRFIRGFESDGHKGGRKKRPN